MIIRKHRISIDRLHVLTGLDRMRFRSRISALQPAIHSYDVYHGRPQRYSPLSFAFSNVPSTGLPPVSLTAVGQALPQLRCANTPWRLHEFPHKHPDNDLSNLSRSRRIEFAFAITPCSNGSSIACNLPHPKRRVCPDAVFRPRCRPRRGLQGMGAACASDASDCWTRVRSQIKLSYHFVPSKRPNRDRRQLFSPRYF
jgi:hypothetical protein